MGVFLGKGAGFLHLCDVSDVINSSARLGQAPAG